MVTLFVKLAASTVKLLEIVSSCFTVDSIVQYINCFIPFLITMLKRIGDYFITQGNSLAKIGKVLGGISDIHTNTVYKSITRAFFIDAITWEHGLRLPSFIDLQKQYDFYNYLYSVGQLMRPQPILNYSLISYNGKNIDIFDGII